jgi:anti-sigma factor RsiW
MTDRLAELLAAEAIDDLSPDERTELERLLAASPEARAEREAMLRTAGLVRRALAGRAMPEGLRDKLARQGETWQAARGAPASD